MKSAPKNPGESYKAAVEIMKEQPLLGYAAIAGLLGISRCRVHQIALQSGMDAQRKKLKKKCSKSIPAARLAAMPDARLCVACLEAEGDVDTYAAYLEVQGKALYEFHPVRGAAKLRHARLQGIGSTRPVKPEFHPVAGRNFEARVSDDGGKRGSGAERGAVYTSGLGEKHSLSR